MIVNTQRLFAKLLPTMRINVVCDVGSMNGADALRFREALPDSGIYAFEPNPDNYRLMSADQTLREHRIQLTPLAASNCDGEAELFVVEADHRGLGSRPDERRGMSSLHRRSGRWAPAEVVRVRTTRLDTFLADKCPPQGRLALWIDTEGKAFEVIEGITGIAQRVHLLHVEVETAYCIGSGQKLYPQVQALLQNLGFAELATDQACSRPQFNALFVRGGLPGWTRLQVAALLVRARLRHQLIRFASKVCPGWLRRYQAMRLRRR